MIQQSEAPVDLEQQLVDDIAECALDPLAFSLYAYPWGEGELATAAGPRDWQKEVFAYIRDHFAGPETHFQPCLIAVSSGHGIGKSAEVAQIIDWAMSTCDDCKVVVTANTGAQLKTKTQPEIAKWFRLSINAHWFEVNAESIKVRDRGHEQTWRTDLISWSIHRTEAFAGLHNKGKRIVVIFDEASAIHDKIWEVTEGALTDTDTEIIWLAFGNPTKNSGRFRECFGKFKHLWKTFQIDSRKVEGTNKIQIQKWIDTYGEDSDFVRVRVRGEFPRAGSTQFISSESVAAARKYRAMGFEKLPRIMSVDVARFGDDQSVVGLRQGRKFQTLVKLRSQDTVQVAERVIQFIESERPDAVVIDGDGIGGAVVDQLKHRGYDRKVKIFEFHGGATPHDENMYFNRRAEIWGMMRDWINAGAEIPDDPELADDLTGVEYGIAPKGQIQLERKEDMKARGMASPDCGDCLAMSFSVNVIAQKPAPQGRPMTSHQRGTKWMG